MSASELQGLREHRRAHLLIAAAVPRGDLGDDEAVEMVIGQRPQDVVDGLHSVARGQVLVHQRTFRTIPARVAQVHVPKPIAPGRGELARGPAAHTCVGEVERQCVDIELTGIPTRSEDIAR